MWHELVLNGIGGNTILEAQHKVSYDEFMSWAAYRRMRGSLNVGLRIDRGSALLASMYANSKSKNGGYRVYDFTPFEEEPPISVDQAMEKWK